LLKSSKPEAWEKAFVPEIKKKKEKMIFFSMP
jgi:hypothetical protein